MNIDLDKIIKSAIKSGKIFIGSKQTINAAETGKAVALIHALNCSENIKEELQYYANLSKIPLYTYYGSTSDLGLACGKPFLISAIAVRSLSEPELLRMIKESYEQKNQN